MNRLIPMIAFVIFAQELRAQDISQDSLKNAILKMNVQIQEIELNLAKSEKKFKQGILLATIGYTTVIAGGLMLGREQDDLGKGLLITGGVAGVVGTVIMLDAFKYLGRPYRGQHVKNGRL